MGKELYYNDTIKNTIKSVEFNATLAPEFPCTCSEFKKRKKAAQQAREKEAKKASASLVQCKLSTRGSA